MTDGAVKTLNNLPARFADSASEPQQLLLAWLAPLEIAILVGIGCTQTFFLHSIEKLADPPSVALSNLGLVLLAALAIVPLRRASKHMRLCLLAVQIATLAVASSLGVTRMFDVLYMLYVARAGVLFDTKLTVGAVVIAIGGHILSKELRYFLTEKYIYAMTPLQHFIHLLIVGRMINFSLALALTAFCAHALLSERRLRAERQRLNAQVEEVARQLERMRMAREIHDSAGHIMTSMCMHIDVAQALINKNRDKAMQSLALAKALVAELSRELQTLALTHETSVNLADELAALLQKHQQECSYRLHVQVDNQTYAISNAAVHDLINMIKESLHNISKYAAASDVWFNLHEHNGIVEARIKDNGVGFDTTQVQISSFGLQGMKERAERHGGKVEIESSPQSGTTVVISLPINRGA